MNAKKILYSAVLLLAAALGGAKALAEHRLEQELRRLESAAGGYARVSHGSLQLSPAGHLQIDTIQAEFPGWPTFSADRLRLPRAYRFYPFPPAQAEAELAGLQALLPESDGEALRALFSAIGYGDYFLSAKELAALGYASLRGGAKLEAAASGADQMRLQLTVRLPGLAELAAQAEVSPLPSADSLRRDWLAQLRLASLRLRYTDQGLLARVAGYLGKRGGKSAGEVRERLAAQMENDARGLGLEDASAAALGQLLRAGGSLELSLQLPEPLSPARLPAWLMSAAPRIPGLKIRHSV